MHTCVMLREHLRLTRMLTGLLVRATAQQTHAGLPSWLSTLRIFCMSWPHICIFTMLTQFNS